MSESDSSMSLPVACTLTAAELAARRNRLLPALLTRADGQEPVPGGFRWRFCPASDLLKQAVAVIDAERRCCRFFRFLLIVEPGEGPVWLEVTGPEGTQESLSMLLNTAPSPVDIA